MTEDSIMLLICSMFSKRRINDHYVVLFNYADTESKNDVLSAHSHSIHSKQDPQCSLKLDTCLHIRALSLSVGGWRRCCTAACAGVWLSVRVRWFSVAYAVT